MSQRVVFEKTWSVLLGKNIRESDFWSSRCEIPIGTLRPYEEYAGEIPMEDIVRIKFDPTSTPSTSRKALNVLALAGSGDGKSMMMKIAWDVLYNAGYYIIYVDPKSTDSGRAVMEWKDSPRLPPMMQPRGIPLAHHIPIWSIDSIRQIEHHFRKYASRLNTIREREMWQGLGMTNIAASKTTKVIKSAVGAITIRELRNAIYRLGKEEIPPGSYDNLLRVLTDLEDLKVVDDATPELDMIRVMRDEKKSVVISYNSAAATLLTWDVGFRIWQAKEYYFTHHNRNPIFIFLDDSSYYAKDMQLVPYNFAVEQIKNIGFNYRSLGVYNWMAVQSLSIIDEKVAEGYKIKLISPYFQNPDSLASINIPKRAIQYIKRGELLTDKERHMIQWLLINEDNDVIPFFPFTPAANHFREIYYPKEEKSEVPHADARV